VTESEVPTSVLAIEQSCSEGVLLPRDMRGVRLQTHSASTPDQLHGLLGACLRHVLVHLVHYVYWLMRSERARPWLSGKVQDFAARMEVLPAGVRVRDLGYRWGSCGKGEWLYFHWKTILLPAQIAEYVVVHEMAHLHEPHHTPGFWRRVERAMPDFERRKLWLVGRGKGVEGL
jgi:hypothetical protein